MSMGKCMYRVVFFNWPPLTSSKYKKVNQARLGVSRTIYVNVDSPNLGFTYFLGGGGAFKKITL